MNNLLIMIGLIAFGAALAAVAFFAGYVIGRRSLESTVRVMQGLDPLRRTPEADVLPETE